MTEFRRERSARSAAWTLWACAALAACDGASGAADMASSEPAPVQPQAGHSDTNTAHEACAAPNATPATEQATTPPRVDAEAATPAAPPSGAAGAEASQKPASGTGGTVAAGGAGPADGSGAAGAGTAPSGDASALSADQLQDECGVAPPGLAPHFELVPSSKTPTVELSLAIQGDPTHPPVVLLHGFPDYWCGWARVMPELAKRYYVVAPDMRGYNRSSKPGDPNDPQDLAAYLMPELTRDLADIVHFVAMRTQQKVSLVAHDWGAIVAWPFAHEFPSELSRLMAISVSHPQALSKFLASGDPALSTAQTQQLQALSYITELVMDSSPQDFSANEYQKLFESLDQKHLRDPGSFPESERAAYKRMWSADDQASFKSQIKYYRANFGGTGGMQPSGELLTPVPTTFIAPVYDGAILYPHSMDYLRENVAADQPLTLRPIDTGHFPQRETPEQLIRMIQQFLDWSMP